MTVTNMPAYVPTEWAPTKMTRKAYNAQRTDLVKQLDVTKAALATLETAYAAADVAGGIFEGLGTAWNSLHDVETAIEFEIWHLDRDWRNRNVDPYQRFLVSNNID